MELTAAKWDQIIDKDPHVWCVKFFSRLCSSCKAFAPTFAEVQKQVPGLHWAQVSIDDKENIALAKRFGVLTEGIPNVKLINAGEVPLNIVSGETPSASEVVSTLKDTLQRAGAATDEAGFYQAKSRAEL